MRSTKLVAGLFVLMTIVASACSRGSSPQAPDASPQMASQPASSPDDLNLARDPAVILSEARALMEADDNVALVTVDAQGQPRIRTVNSVLTDVDPSDPSKGFTVWVLTRDTTRKVAQVKQNPKVTLYYNDDSKTTYATIMGIATVHSDANDPRVQPFLDPEKKKFFWPDFPKAFTIIEIQPTWIEFVSPKFPGHEQHWTPEAVILQRTSSTSP